METEKNKAKYPKDLEKYQMIYDWLLNEDKLLIYTINEDNEEDFIDAYEYVEQWVRFKLETLDKEIRFLKENI